MYCRECGCKHPLSIPEGKKRCMICGHARDLSQFKKLPPNHYLQRVHGQKGCVVACNGCVDARKTK